MYGSPTGGQSDSLHFYSMHRGKYLFVSHLFSKEGRIVQFFNSDLIISSYTMSSWVLRVIKITWKVSESKKRTIIWRQNLPMLINRGVRFGIVVQHLDTINTYSVAKMKKSDNVIQMQPNIMAK